MRTCRSILLLLLVNAAPVMGTALTLTLTTPIQNALAGETITFGGILTNNENADVDLNAISFTLSGLFNSDGSLFLDVSAPLTVAANSSTLPYDWFTVTVPDPFPGVIGLYTATVTIQGGVEIGGVYDGSVLDLLGSTDFGINVLSTTSVPDPVTAALVGLGGSALAALRRRRLRG